MINRSRHRSVRRIFRPGAGNQFLYSSHRLTKYLDVWLPAKNFTGKANIFGDAVFGYDYFSKASANMLKSDIYQYPDGTTNTPTNYVYDYDALGSVIRQTATPGNNINISLYAYYKCSTFISGH